MVKNYRLAVVAILAVLLLSGCSWGKKSTTQPQLLNSMAGALSEVKTLAFDLNILAVNQDKTTTVELALTGQGQIARDDQSAGLSSDFSYQTTQEGKNFSLSGKLLSTDQKTYFKFNNLPKTGLLSYFKLTTDWYQLPTADTARDLVSSTAAVDQSTLAPWFTGQQFLVVEEDLGKDFIDQTKVEKFRVTVDIQKFVAAAKASAKNQGRDISSSELKSLDKFLQDLNKAGGVELWLGQEDSLPRQIILKSWPLSNPADVTATVSLKLFDFNQTVDLKAPATAKIFDPQTLLGLTPSKP